MDFAHASAISLPNPSVPSKFRHSSTAKRLSCYYTNGCELYSKEFSYCSYPAAIKCLKSSVFTNSSAIRMIGGASTHRKKPSRRVTSSIPCNVRNEESSEPPPSSERTIVDEKTLEKELQDAIETENYAEAARIRDQLRLLHEDSRASILSTNAQFYNAFRKGDLATMETLWAPGDKVCCIHPGASGISGYESVMKSWEYVWMNYEFPLEIVVKDVEVYVKGNMGYVTLVEMVKTKGGSGWGRQFATNVFEKVDGQWLICIHHASPVDL